MKHLIITLLILLPLFSNACGKSAGNETKPEPQQTSLSREEAESIRLKVISDWKESVSDDMQKNLSNLRVTDGKGHTMKFLVDVYGNEPVGGHSLWISLHGGGGTTKDVNDGQWRNQQVMYRRANPPQPTEGYYVSPRAIEDVWNMWFLKENDFLFEQIIRTMVVVNGVNPDKVYLLGYSAGGDGLWRMAPRMADHWAAASMMAGHPGSTRFENIRNMPFMMWVGADDTAYDRNTLVPATSEKIDALQASDPQGYIHECHVLAGKPHWMDLEDAAAFPWMAEYKRNPYPTRIVWRQEAEEEKVLRPSFYWLKPAEEELAGGKTVIAEIKGNTIVLEQCDYKTLTIYLNDSMLNLDSDVTVKYKDKEVFKGPVPRYESTLRETMLDRGDPSYVFCSEITVKL